MSSAPDFISTLNKKTKDLVYWGFTEHARLIILFVFILVCRGSVNPLYYPHQCTIHFLHNPWNMFLMLKEIHVFIIALKERFWCFDKGGLMQDEFCCEVHHPVSLLRHRRLRRCCSCWCFCRRSFFGGCFCLFVFVLYCIFALVLFEWHILLNVKAIKDKAIAK